jgi:hypothetical protein
MQAVTLSAEYGVHFKKVLFPFSIIEIVSSLERLGYDISPEMPFPRPVGRFSGTGEIGRKGKLSIQVDGSAKILRSVGVSIPSALTSFNELVKALNEDYKVDIAPLVRFYQVMANYQVITTNNAIKKIADKSEAPVLKEFSKILGREIASTELKFGAKDLEPNSENWFDIHIIPNYERNDRYLFSLVYRNAEKEKTQVFIDHIEENIVKFAEFIDR